MGPCGHGPQVFDPPNPLSSALRIRDCGRIAILQSFTKIILHTLTEAVVSGKYGHRAIPLTVPFTKVSYDLVVFHSQEHCLPNLMYA